MSLEPREMDIKSTSSIILWANDHKVFCLEITLYSCQIECIDDATCGFFFLTKWEGTILCKLQGIELKSLWKLHY